jgi:hypothetical protein
MSEQTLEFRSCRVTFSSPWVAEDDGEELSLHRSKDGSITISTYRHSDPQARADALEKCRRFVAELGSDIGCAKGSVSEANAELKDSKGERWIVRTVARENRFVLVTYNSTHPSAIEEREMRRILASIELVG